MNDPEGTAFGVLGVLMRREKRQSIRVTYDELSAEPIRLLIAYDDDGSVTVMLPPEELDLTPEELTALQREACEAGRPITRRFQ